MNRIVALILLMIMSTSSIFADDFVKIGSDGTMQRRGHEYRFVGTNLWYGPILASPTDAGDNERLMTELDSLQALGVSNLRILAGAEGPEGYPHHISPVLQPSPGVYNQSMLQGLDRFMAEVERRDMTVVIYLTNAWEWSGGYGSYLEWATGKVCPIPGIDGYREYVNHVKDFVLSDSAKQMALDHAKFIVGRVNSVTGKPYSESPAILSWQIANEPRAFSDEGKDALHDWIIEMARVIKEIDKNHLVSTGSEGKYGCEIDLDLWQRIHNSPEIDYGIIHLWPTNWGWASRQSPQSQVDAAIKESNNYIDEHIQALSPGKPIVIEEFGYPRDDMALAPGSPTTGRDEYYAWILRTFCQNPRLCGINFWGWNGSGRPQHKLWQSGDPYLCDPAHEPQGLYGVYDADVSTLDVIKKCGNACEE